MRRRRGLVAAVLLALTACEAGEAPPDGAPGSPSPSVVSASVASPSARTPGGPPSGATGADPELGFDGAVPPGARPQRSPGTTVYGRSTPEGVCAGLGTGEPLEMTTTDAAEAHLLDDWAACVRTDTTPAYTWLRNDTGAVWSLPGAPWAIVQEHSPGESRLGVLQSGVLHRATEGWTGSPGAAAFIHPGESVWIGADPGRVQWRVDLPLTLTWAAVGAMVDRADDRGSGAMAEFLRRREAGASIATTCAAGFYDYVRDRDVRDREDLVAADPGAVVREGFEALADGTPCSEAAAALHVHRGGREVTVLEDVIRAVPRSGATLERIRADVGPYRETRGVASLRLQVPGGPTPTASAPAG